MSGTNSLSVTFDVIRSAMLDVSLRRCKALTAFQSEKNNCVPAQTLFEPTPRSASVARNRSVESRFHETVAV